MVVMIFAFTTYLESQTKASSCQTRHRPAQLYNRQDAYRLVVRGMTAGETPLL